MSVAQLCGEAVGSRLQLGQETSQEFVLLPAGSAGCISLSRCLLSRIKRGTVES